MTKVDFQVPCLQVGGSHKGNATQEDSQRRFLAQHSVATLLQHCFEELQHCSNIATWCCAKNRHCESSHVTSPEDIRSSSESLLLLAESVKFYLSSSPVCVGGCCVLKLCQDYGFLVLIFLVLIDIPVC